MNKLVTIGIPVYKRFEYLPSVLNIVASQDYPNIDLLVSDNGMNGTAVRDIVDKYYPKPYRFRQNSSTVGISEHFNQLIQNASGYYFVVLADDDEISPNYVSDLVSVLERNSQASIAFAIQESIDEKGSVIGRSKDTVPETLPGADFVRAAWVTQEYGFRSFSTFVARTEKLLKVGGFPVFWVAQGDEDALIVKLSLDSLVAFSTRSVFRKRFHDSSDQHSLPIHDLAKGLRDFVHFFDTDRYILSYAAAHPAQWAESKQYLVDMAWKTYLYRWANLYKVKLPATQWITAAFELPLLPRYYKPVASTLSKAALEAALGQFKRFFPHAYEACRRTKHRFHKAV